MTKRPQLKPALLTVILLLVPSVTFSQGQRVGGVVTLEDNGAWSWFQGERAVVDTKAGKLLVSTVSDSKGPGGEDRNGDVDVRSLDLQSGQVDHFVLHDSLEADDHNTAAFFVRPDGRYVAMYGGHVSDNFSRCRISKKPGDISNWTDELKFDNQARMTYSNLHYLPNARKGKGQLYNMVRSNGFDPNILISDDLGETWSYGGRLLIEGSGSDRPYVRYFNDGKKIHFITTERHPRDFDNSIYHGYIKDQKLHDANGNVVDNNLMNEKGVAPNQLTSVLKTGTKFGRFSMDHAWTVDMAIDEGTPVAVIQARANNNDADHRFFYGRCNDGEWNLHEIGFAGSHLYPAENDYTGLVAIDPDQTNTIYLSSEVHPETKAQLIGSDGKRHYELFRGVTADEGASWSWTPLTMNSSVDNIRPVVPAWNEEKTAIVWLHGNYYSYTDYDMQVVTSISPELPEAKCECKVDFCEETPEQDYQAFKLPADPNASSITQTLAISSTADSASSTCQLTLAGKNLTLGAQSPTDQEESLAKLSSTFASATDTLTLTFDGLPQANYQLVLYSHQNYIKETVYNVEINGKSVGKLTPSNTKSLHHRHRLSFGIASARIAFSHATEQSTTVKLISEEGKKIVLNGLELWTGGKYVSP